MDYFSKFLRPSQDAAPKPTPTDHARDFEKAWTYIENTLLYPDERQLARGIQSTDVPARLQIMVDALVTESAQMEEGTTGSCMEFLLKNDVLGTLVKLAETDRPSGIQAEVLRAIQSMVVQLDEQFLVHSAVHKAVLRLLRNCVGDDIQEQLDSKKVMGAAKNAVRSQPSEYEEDLVHLLCILCSRIRTYRELLMIFFHDKHWFKSEPLFAVEEEDEEEEEEDLAPASTDVEPDAKPPSPTLSQRTIKSAKAPTTSGSTKVEYEFLLFNYLLRFVHREGKIGDFARAGLLFLMDVAMSPGAPLHRLTGEESPASAPTPSTDPITDAALALAEYIVDGDFSMVLGAGLSAVYSTLPSKLEIRAPEQTSMTNANGMVLGGLGNEAPDDVEAEEMKRESRRSAGVEESTNPDFKSRLDHFLRLLEFLQDVLRRNVQDPDPTVDPSTLVGNAIVNAILDAVRKTFLENVFYPSILECSEADGSAVAVMAYIEVMISTLKRDQLADMLVEFLISEDSDQFAKPRQRQSVLRLVEAPPQSKSALDMKEVKKSRRKSAAMALLEIEAPDSTKQSEYFTSMARFTLKDLLLANLRSHSQPTAAAALQLLQAMLVHHCHLSVDKLLLVMRDPQATNFPVPAMLSLPWDEKQLDFGPGQDDDETSIYPGSDNVVKTLHEEAAATFHSIYLQPDTTVSTHEREIGLYFTLVSRVDPAHNDDAFSTGYEHYLRDALLAIENHTCFADDMDPEVRTKAKHKLNPNDPILSLILDSLRTFFANTPEFNVSLTGVLAMLAACPDRSLAGWLTFSHNHASGAEDDNLKAPEEDGDDRSVDFRINDELTTESNPLPAATMNDQSKPIVHTIFLGLVSQLERYRQQVDDFDKYLLERRQGLLFSENLTDALTLSLEPETLAPFASRASFSNPTTPSAGVNVEAPSRPKPKQGMFSFLNPKKTKPTLSTPTTQSESNMVPRSSTGRIEASPFGPHYKHTGSVSVEPYAAPLPTSGSWTPKKQSSWTHDEDVFGTGGQWGDNGPSWEDGETHTKRVQEEHADHEAQRKVTLSHLLDNVVVLEESIKELVAIIQARRSLGIDSVRYV